VSTIKTYIEDAIAAEKTFEDQLQGFAKESDDTVAKDLYTQHARETHAQYDQLTARLDGLDGSPSILKSVMAHVFGAAPKIAQIGHDTADRQTQNLMMAYAVENAEVAMYESLIVAARLSGDTATELLARSIQVQEKATAEKLWAQIAPAAARSIELATTD
jgi:ferritin-like metal-binding protein YciE